MYGFLLVYFSNFVPKTHRFLRYSTYKYPVTLKPGLGSLKVIGNITRR